MQIDISLTDLYLAEIKFYRGLIFAISEEFGCSSQKSQNSIHAKKFITTKYIEKIN